MSFFETQSGVLYPISRIESMTMGRPADKPGGEPTRAQVRLVDGSTVKVYPHEIDVIRRSSARMIAATPGLYLLTYYYDPKDANDPGPYVHMEPILGWRQDTVNGGVEPIMLDPHFEEMLPNHGVLDTQTGRVYNPTEGNYDNQAIWEASVKASIDREPDPRLFKSER